MGDRRIFELSEINDYNENDEFVLNQFNTKVDKKIKAKNLVSESTIRNEVDTQLQAHPEWRATVLDKSLEPIKMHDSMWDAVKGMPVNSANQIISDRYESDNEPYLIRESNSVGNRVEEEIVGVSVAWNQLVQNGDFASDSGWSTRGGTTFSINNNVATVTFGADSISGLLNVYMPLVVNHKYLVMAYIKSTDTGTLQMGLTTNGGSLTAPYVNVTPTSNWVEYYAYNTLTSAPNVSQSANGLILRRNTSSSFSIDVKNVRVYDITLMFGSTIADYVYSLEQATKGSGIAWLKSYGYFTKEYYEYITGGIKSVNTEGKTVTDGTNIKTYPTSNIDLRGIPKLVNNKLVYDGDIYHSSGVVDRKYGIVDLGTLTWGLGGSGNKDFWASYSDFPVISTTTMVPKLISTKYKADTFVHVFNNPTDKTCGFHNLYHRIYIADFDYTDATAFKTAMNGVYLVFELATPTTEQADPYVQIQEVYKDGTEEWIDERDIPIPVGHNSKYYYDLKEKIEYQPDLAQSDGKYVIEQDDGKLDLTPLGDAVNPLIEDKIDEALGLPNENGKYYFAGEVEGTSADYGWQKDNNAKVDGEYDDLVNGSSKQLLSKKYYEDNTPYLFRANPYEYESDRLDEEIVGGSLAWNQLVQNGNFESTSGWQATTAGSFTVANNVLTYTYTGLQNNTYGNIIQKTSQNVIMPASHLIYCAYSIKPARAIGGIYIWATGGENQQIVVGTNISAGVWTRVGAIFRRSASATSGSNLQVKAFNPVSNNYEVGDVDYVKDVICVDLTLALGSVIADYAFSLEQATAGSGIAWLKSQGFFTKDYYAYNAGGIQSVKTSAKKVVGFNQWDEQWQLGSIYITDGTNASSTSKTRSKNHIPVFPSTTYCISWGSGYASDTDYIYYYDANKNYISYITYKSSSTSGNKATFTTPSNACYVRFIIKATSYSNDICINLHWDGEHDGEYEAYVEHTYPLDSDLELRGIPKLVNGKIKYDGDTYASDGTVTRRFGADNLGNLTWTEVTMSNNRTAYYASQLEMMGIPLFDTTNITTQNIIQYGTDFTWAYQNQSSWAVNSIVLTRTAGIFPSNSLGIITNTGDYNNAEAFKSAMTNKYLVYELATPTTESADPYTNPQLVDNWGTEEFIDERAVPVPVGHESRYLYDLKGKIEQLYGIPKPPSTNGTYILKATVSASGVEYSWVTN